MAENLDEQLLAGEEEEEARRAELARGQQQASLARRLLSDEGSTPIINRARAAASTAKKLQKTAKTASAIAEAASAVWGAIAALSPVILVIVAIFGIIILIVATLTVLCNGNWVGRLAVAGAGTLVGQDFCKALSGLKGVLSTVDTASIGGPPIDGGSCPTVKRPPTVTEVKCIDCVDLKDVAPEVKVKNSSLANRGAAQKVKDLGKANKQFWVTEAFCPTSEHASHDHYNGYAIDVNIPDESQRTPANVYQLYRDVESLGVSSLICEYPSGFLANYNISCQGSEFSSGSHIHFVEPHSH